MEHSSRSNESSSRWLKDAERSTGQPPVWTALFPPGKGGGKGVGYGRKGKGVTIHCLVEKKGLPLSALVTPANADERQQVFPLLEKVKARTGKRGRPKKRPKTLAADKGYDSRKLRQALRRRGIRPEIPRRKWKGRKQPPGRKLVKRVARFVVERTFAWLQRKFRRLVVRWERLEVCFDAFVHVAIIMIWLQQLLVG